MVMPFQYVRRKNNPKEYIMAGYTDFSDQFDMDLYEVVQGELPKDAERQIRQNYTDKINALIQIQSTVDRVALYQLQASINLALANKDNAAAKVLLQQVPTVSKALKDRLMDLLSQK